VPLDEEKHHFVIDSDLVGRFPHERAPAQPAPLGEIFRVGKPQGGDASRRL
jgi:hypothetical protein